MTRGLLENGVPPTIPGFAASTRATAMVQTRRIGGCLFLRLAGVDCSRYACPGSHALLRFCGISCRGRCAVLAAFAMVRYVG